eukprot:scaffold3844_cov105-Cylindrotheca_fusiformis.AAC.4
MLGTIQQEKYQMSPRMIDWERTFASVISMNNMAVSLIRCGQFKDVQSPIVSAIMELKHVSEGVSMFSRQTSCPEQSSDTVPLDDWMSVSPRIAQEMEAHELQADAFFLFREGIIIPTSIANDCRYSHQALCKAISFVVFFNQGLACHLRCCSRKYQLSHQERQRLVSNADQMYRLAMQYRKEERTSNGRFLLAVCNNIAVLDRQFIATGACRFQMEAYNLSTINSVGAGFEYLKLLLRRFPLSPSSTIEEIQLWNSYLNNLRIVMATVGGRSNCAGAA